MAKFNANGHKFEAGMVKPVDQDGNYIIDSNDRIILGNKILMGTGMEQYIQL